MTGFRHKSAGLIDRKKPIRFYFNRSPITGFEGDTIASALMAAGKMLVGRSFKYHRPRGIMSAGLSEGGALFNVHDGARRIANVKGPCAEIRPDMQVYSQNAFPSVQFDIGAVNGMLAPFIGAGFYYKTFMGPMAGTKFWMFCEKFIRRAAGMGQAMPISDPDQYDRAYDFCDVLIIGAGPAGLAAAVALAEEGRDVILIEQEARIGGDRLTTGRAADLAEIKNWEARFKAAGGRLWLRSTGFGIYDGLVTGVLERVCDHLHQPPPDMPREIFHIVHPRQIILATGASERMMAFSNNDRPGVMYAHAMAIYAARYGVLAGRSAVLATCHDGTYEDALILRRLGMEVTLLDARHEGGAMGDAVVEAGVTLMLNRVPINVLGRRQVAGVELGQWEGKKSKNTIVGCDVVGLSAGYNPTINLLSHRGIKPIWNDRICGFLGGKTREEIYSIGAADGFYAHEACMHSVDALITKLLGGAKLRGKKSAPPHPQNRPKLMPLFEIRGGRKHKAFIDPQHDVTTDDVRQAHAENFCSVEHLKRYTTLGMATDQGRAGNILGLAIMAEARGVPISEAGVTQFRPPFSPISIGALAGRARDAHWQPLRRTPMHHLHEDHGALMIETGLWQRAWVYLEEAEAFDEATIREAATVRQNLAMVDVSTLGKIAIQGPDATEFLDRIYVNPFAKLKIGKARYGIMLRDDGMILDDGTTWRLAEHDYFMTTTTAQAGTVMTFLEELLQTRWTDLRVHVSSVTDQWAGMAIAGPGARMMLAKAIPHLSWSNEDFPVMAVRETQINLGGMKTICRVARISFSGERAWEIYVPADKGAAIWQGLTDMIEAAGGCLYGLEALGVLRIEKGHVTAAELDGRVSLEDAGFAAMGKKERPYIGSVLRKRPALCREDRPQLVGIFPKTRTQYFSAGAVLCTAEQVSSAQISGAQISDPAVGWVTASAQSPALGHWIGLGFIKGGVQAWQGQVIYVADPIHNRPNGNFIEAEIVSPHMFDPKGRRQNG